MITTTYPAGAAPLAWKRDRPSCFPSTRYQGSKRKLAAGIVAHLRGLEFTTVLDAFGGTGAIAYALKCEGKQVTYNDVLAFNHQIGLALIENDGERLKDDEIESIGRHLEGVTYDDFIERTFDGIYFTREENRWLDAAVTNIRGLDGRYPRALAWFALFQSALAKRPYNLFHRSNLFMRTADVPRSFGNKSTWDRSFADHFRRFADQANQAVVDGRAKCRAICRDVSEVEPGFDLVYIDPPYLNRRGVGVDYQHFYHFLEGLTDYARWDSRIDRRFKHLPFVRQPQPWTDRRRIHAAFAEVFERFRGSTLVVSYRSDGIPTAEELETMLRTLKRRVQVIATSFQYALSTQRETRELLFIASDP